MPRINCAMCVEFGENSECCRMQKMRMSKVCMNNTDEYIVCFCMHIIRFANYTHQTHTHDHAYSHIIFTTLKTECDKMEPGQWKGFGDEPKSGV